MLCDAVENGTDFPFQLAERKISAFIAVRRADHFSISLEGVGASNSAQGTCHTLKFAKF